MSDIPQYPWVDGEVLYAEALNAAFANMGGGATGTSFGFPLMQAQQPAGGFASSPFPFGTNNQACALSCNIWPPDPNGRPIFPQVSGWHQPSELATAPDRGYVTFYAGANSRAVTTVTVNSATYDATTIYLSPPLTSTQLTFVQQAIANTNARASLWNNAPSYISANIGMQIDTMLPPSVTITSGTYNSSTGAVSLTTSAAHGMGSTSQFTVSGAAGTGSFASLNGTFNATSGTTGTTLDYTIATGLTLTITGGTVQPSKFTGCITAVASDGSSISVSGWFQQGNQTAGQIPANGITAYINPCTKIWNMNGISWLDASNGPSPTGNNQCNQITFLEVDMWNNQAPVTGAPGSPMTIGISCNSSANTNGYGFIALGNWSTGFMSSGNVNTGYLIRQDPGANPSWGFLSQVNSTISGGHHPFGYYDASLATYRFSVGSNGTLALGAPGHDNGLSIAVSAPGTPPIISAVGPDTNINLRLHPQGTGYIQCDGDIWRNANTAPIVASGAYNARLRIQGQDGGIPTIEMISFAERNLLAFRRADNIGAAPATLAAGDLIGAIYGYGFDGTAWTNYHASISLNAASAGGAWSTTSHPASISFGTTAINSTLAALERMRIYPSGNVAIQPSSQTYTDDGANALQVGGSIRVGAIGTGPTWSAGAGAPSGTQPVGSLYSNTSGAVGSTLYVSRGAGTWNAVAGV